MRRTQLKFSSDYLQTSAHNTVSFGAKGLNLLEKTTQNTQNLIKNEYQQWFETSMVKN